MKGNIQRVNLGEREGVVKLGRMEGMKTVAGMYCMRGEPVFNKKREN